MLACFGGAPARRQPPGCFANSYCDGVRPEKPRAPKETAHPRAQQSDADISQAPDDLEPELRSPLDAAQKWPSQPETWGRRSVISPHRALVARPDPGSAPGVQDRGKSHGSPSAARELFQLARQASSDEEPMDGATRSVGSDHTRSSSSSEASDEDTVEPLKKPMKTCLRTRSCSCSVDSENDEFEETQKSLQRANDPRRVRFRAKHAIVRIPNLEDYGWRARRDCYWQPEEYAQMARSRIRLERAVLETGGRAVIPGESRRGLGLVCEPETRLARASKIQQTARAVLRLHANGAAPGRLARFAAEQSRWATRNALICADKDLIAAQEALRDAARSPSIMHRSLSASRPVDMPRCDSNTAATDGLASMIRHDSLNDLSQLHNGSPLSLSEYSASATRRRIAPAAA